MRIRHRLIVCGIGISLAVLGHSPAADPPANKPPEIKRPILFNTPEADAIVAHMQIFPADNPWNTDISKWPVHPDSDAIIASIGTRKPLRVNADMGFILVPPDQKKIDLVTLHDRQESDPGPFPIPDGVPIEGWPAAFRQNPQTKDLTLDDVQRDTLGRADDRHAIVVDVVHRKLYEFYQLKKVDRGWEAGQSSIFDLDSNKLRPDGWTSTDAAGLPIFPSIVRYDELQSGVVKHALRVGVRNTRRAYVSPATHYASRKTDKNLPRMGERIRLKADVDLSKFSPPVRTILQALKTYGMFVADNGLEWTLSMAPDERITPMHAELRKITGDDFEVVTAPK